MVQHLQNRCSARLPPPRASRLPSLRAQCSTPLGSDQLPVPSPHPTTSLHPPSLSPSLSSLSSSHPTALAMVVPSPRHPSPRCPHGLLPPPLRSLLKGHCPSVSFPKQTPGSYSLFHSPHPSSRCDFSIALVTTAQSPLSLICSSLRGTTAASIPSV
jgi:hypothetical protein